jgi:hypothetical protein
MLLSVHAIWAARRRRQANIGGAEHASRVIARAMKTTG